MFSIDGLEWPYPCTVGRAAEVKASEISGLLLDGSYFNDVLGTYMKYSLQLAIPVNEAGLGDSIYEKLTEPVDGHVFVFPYNGSTITLTGRLEGDVSDVYVRQPNGRPLWKGLSFTIVANHPSKSMTLNEVIQRGLMPVPDVSSPSVGDTYTYTANGWQKVI